MDSLTKTKEFDRIKIAKGGLRYNGRNMQTHAKVLINKSCSYCGSSHPPSQCLAYGKKCADCGKINHFREVHRSRRNTAVHNKEQVPDQCNIEEDHIDTVNINSFIFNGKWLAKTANLKMSSSQVSITIPYKVDTGSDVNIMPLHKKIFTRSAKEQFAAIKNENMQLKMYNKAVMRSCLVMTVTLDVDSELLYSNVLC